MAEELTKEIPVDTMSEEDMIEAWKQNIRSEIGALLDMFLDKAVSCDRNVRYVPHVVEKTEAGDVLNKAKADGVLLSIILKFENPIDLTKPRVTEGGSEA